MQSYMYLINTYLFQYYMSSNFYHASIMGIIDGYFKYPWDSMLFLTNIRQTKKNQAISIFHLLNFILIWKMYASFLDWWIILASIPALLLKFWPLVTITDL